MLPISAFRRHCERSEAIQSLAPQELGEWLWIAPSLRSSQ
jgi:hypothetical protein